MIDSIAQFDPYEGLLHDFKLFDANYNIISKQIRNNYKQNRFNYDSLELAHK